MRTAPKVGLASALVSGFLIQSGCVDSACAVGSLEKCPQVTVDVVEKDTDLFLDIGGSLSISISNLSGKEPVTVEASLGASAVPVQLEQLYAVVAGVQTAVVNTSDAITGAILGYRNDHPEDTTLNGLRFAAKLTPMNLTELGSQSTTALKIKVFEGSARTAETQLALANRLSLNKTPESRFTDDMGVDWLTSPLIMNVGLLNGRLYTLENALSMTLSGKVRRYTMASPSMPESFGGFLSPVVLPQPSVAVGSTSFLLLSQEPNQTGLQINLCPPDPLMNRKTGCMTIDSANPPGIIGGFLPLAENEQIAMDAAASGAVLSLSGKLYATALPKLKVNTTPPPVAWGEISETLRGVPQSMRMAVDTTGRWLVAVRSFSSPDSITASVFRSQSPATWTQDQKRSNSLQAVIGTDAASALAVGSFDSLGTVVEPEPQVVVARGNQISIYVRRKDGSYSSVTHTLSIPADQDLKSVAMTIGQADGKGGNDLVVGYSTQLKGMDSYFRHIVFFTNTL